MRKGQKKRIWTKEQKLEIIHKHINEHISAGSLSKEYNADKSMICHWIRDYEKYGEAAFDSKSHKKGNPFAALHTSKTLTETERLRLQLAKLEIENERLKKGYQVKGVGANKEFVTTKDVNTK
ncbi:MAG: transposase [Acutalibacteraceae bacterium]|nr:transposase [Acutalibacteraceae bacterium]